MTRVASHTPGPWAVHESGAQIIGGTGLLTSVANTFGPAWAVAPRAEDRAKAEEHHANARLIAAAPELLAVLQEIMAPSPHYSATQAWRDQVSSVRARARAAILKATGRSDG